MEFKGAEILVQALIDQGVDTVFGYPGGSVLDIYDALYKKSDEIDHVLTAHEQGASHAADGYARATGKVGVCLATSGPGATNLVTGIATAYLDSVPMVALTGNVATGGLGKDSFQEVDTVGITLPIVKHSYIVRDVKDLEETINEAFKIAAEGRKGPVLIDIPKDVQNGLATYKGIAKEKSIEEERPPVDQIDFTEALEAISKSQRPYIYAGGGTLREDMGQNLIEFSKKIGAPIGTSLMGKTTLPASYDLDIGAVGMHGREASNLAQDKSDLVIGIGVRFSDRATGDISQYIKGRTFIHIDIDAAEMSKNILDIIPLKGDAKDIVQELTRLVEQKDNKEWLDKVKEAKAKDDDPGDTSLFIPKNIIRTINQWASEDTVVATDVGQHQMWVMQHYRFEKPRKLLTSGGLGTMGYGFGAAIGGCIGNDRKATVLFTGDGSFSMNLNEFATAVSQDLPILIVLLNNSTLGMVRQWQTRFYDKRYSSTNLGIRKTNYVDLAKAFGADGRRVRTMEELEDALKEDILAKGPYLLECVIDIDQEVLPMIPAGKSVKDMIID